MIKPKFENPLAEVMRGAFREWGPNSATYKKLWRKVTKDGLELADIALGEIDILAPGPLWTWYTFNHMRFYKMRGEEIRITIELLQYFLADYAHGRLRKQYSGTTSTSEKEKTNTTLVNQKSRQEADRSTGRDAAHRLPINKGTKRTTD